MGRLAPILLIEMELAGKEQQFWVIGVLAPQGLEGLQGLPEAPGIGIGEGGFPVQLPLQELPPPGFIPHGRGLAEVPFLGIEAGQVDDGFLMGVPGFPGRLVNLQGLLKIADEQKLQAVLALLLTVRVLLHQRGQDARGFGMVALAGPEPGQGHGIILLAPLTAVKPEVVGQGLVDLLAGLGIASRFEAQGCVPGGLLQQALINRAGRLVVPLPVMEQGQEMQGLRVVRKLGGFLFLERNGFGKAVEGDQQLHQLAPDQGGPGQLVEALAISDGQGPIIAPLARQGCGDRQQFGVLGVFLKPPGQQLKCGLPVSQAI